MLGFGPFSGVKRGVIKEKNDDDTHKERVKVFDAINEGKAETIIKNLKTSVFGVLSKLMDVATDNSLSPEQKKAIKEAEKAVDSALTILRKVVR